MAREPKSYPMTATFAGKIVPVGKTTHRDPYGRPLAEKVAGRPRNFDEATAARMQEALRAFLVDQMVFTGSATPPKRQDRLVKGFLRELMVAEGVDSSATVIDRQITRPVYRTLINDQKTFGH